MPCAVTVRKLEPGTFEQSRLAFIRNGDPENPDARRVDSENRPVCSTSSWEHSVRHSARFQRACNASVAASTDRR
jgi:hypothetical protein